MIKKKFQLKNSQIFITDDINPDDNQSTLDVETKEKFDVKMNEIKKQNNQNVVIDALSNKEILDSIVFEKTIAQKMYGKEQALKTIHSKLETILVDDADFNDIKTKPQNILIEEDEVKNSPQISDANIDFEVVGQYPSPYYLHEIEVIGRLKPLNTDAELDNAETIKYTSDNDDNETIMYASDTEVRSDMENMEYDDIMITPTTPLHPRKRLERHEKIKK